MPIFPVPPVGPEDDDPIGETVREIVGNRNYSTKARFGEGALPRGDAHRPESRTKLRTRLRQLFRR